MKPRAMVVMGVAGSGKTTVGMEIAHRLGAVFIEGDQLHPAANVAKMAAGAPLTDEERRPWLEAIGAQLRGHVMEGDSVVAACSALRRAYRDILRVSSGVDLLFVHLAGSRALIGGRLGQRRGHFFPPKLLDSQFATLEPPQRDEWHIVADGSLLPEDMVAQIMREIGAQEAGR